MKTPKQIQESLAGIAPHVAVQTDWSLDGDAPWAGDWTENEDPDDWSAWNSEVSAQSIDCGRIFSGVAHLGGTWGRFAQCPWKENEDISGYYPQMLEKALRELLEQLPADSTTRIEVRDAIAYITNEMRERYEEQTIVHHRGTEHRGGVSCRDAIAKANVV